MALTALGFGVGAILIIIGIILLIIGTIFYNQRASCEEEISAWIWIMIAIGILLMLIGLVIIIGSAFRAANKNCDKNKYKGSEIEDHHEDEYSIV